MRRLKLLSHHYHTHALAAAILFAIIGSITVFGTQAASFIAAGEAETGTLNGNAKTVDDASASGGQAVSFDNPVNPGPGPAPPPLSISVSGNKLVDSNNQPVQLRGVNRSGTQYMCIDGSSFFDGPTDAAALSKIKAWGANTVRVSLNEDCWLGINGAPAAYSGTNYHTAIKDYVGRLNAQGLRVILDLHWAAPGTTETTSSLDQLPMADRDHAPAFWSSVASQFKDNPSVLFDLFNEPFPDSNKNTAAAWACVRDGGSCPGVNYTVAGSQEMVNAIRTAGANNVIMVGGPQYAGVVDKWTQYKPTDLTGQLAASIHIYFNTPASPEWSPCYLQSCWDSTMAPLAATSPIIIGELGEKDCNTGLIHGTTLSPAQQDIMDWSDAHGVSYLAWSWIAGNCSGEPALITDYNGTPSGYGAIIHDHLTQRIGQP